MKWPILAFVFKRTRGTKHWLNLHVLVEIVDEFAEFPSQLSPRLRNVYTTPKILKPLIYYNTKNLSF